MRTMILAAMLIAAPAFATKTPAPPPATPDPVATADAAAQSDAAAKAAALAGAAAQANGDQSVTAPVTTQVSSELSPSYNTRTTAIGLSMASPIPIAPVDCFKPAPGYKRAHRILFGAWEVSALVELDANCLIAKEEQDNRRLEMMRLELELERERNRRIELETLYIEKTGK